MRHVTLSGIVKSCLHQKGLPIHYYPRYLKYGSDCLRELLFDTLQVTNIVRLPANDFNEVQIPQDCVDWCSVGVQIGQWKRPLIKKDTLNQLANIDTSTGTQISYPNPQYSNWGYDIPYGDISWWGVNVNTNGEFTGGQYGIGA